MKFWKTNYFFHSVLAYSNVTFPEVCGGPQNILWHLQHFTFNSDNDLDDSLDTPAPVLVPLVPPPRNVCYTSFFVANENWHFNDFFFIFVDMGPSGSEISKRYSSYKWQPKAFELFLNFLPNDPHKKLRLGFLKLWNWNFNEFIALFDYSQVVLANMCATSGILPNGQISCPDMAIFDLGNRCP